jgi:hypothetical protein
MKHQAIVQAALIVGIALSGMDGCALFSERTRHGARQADGA